jgi:hypothetical protein
MIKKKNKWNTGRKNGNYFEMKKSGCVLHLLSHSFPLHMINIFLQPVKSISLGILDSS